MLIFFFYFSCQPSSWTRGTTTHLLHSPSLREVLLTELTLRSVVWIAKYYSPWHDEGHCCVPASIFFFLINFSLHYDIIKSEQQQTAVPCLRTGVRVAKWQCCQRGKGNWIHFKATFFLFVGKLAFFLCATSPSPPFSLIEIPGKGKHICWHFQWVILSKSSGLISCLRYVQCSHLLSSLFCSKWLFRYTYSFLIKAYLLIVSITSLKRILEVKVYPWWTIGSPSGPSQQSTAEEKQWYPLDNLHLGSLSVEDFETPKFPSAVQSDTRPATQHPTLHFYLSFHWAECFSFKETSWP